ncbi:F420-0--gamma-glutamyl ligase [Caenibius tardaugens NBRC 16725]|uniref:F420-0--gamma-glutamyl ligase n=1 Tax=Caenibius tardaugens NBRC 16725 TaxID=1219035 RepID=U2YJV1_9SPHN|nr:coenzyme F420-0:L-glutamate ligase [Caenibius tardaugens]AZI34957.1 coenzyme F420-0:L-glutamate ligase [Caenibius tardaugens NBRC 16725]GAD48502.1 F420-0--gamma-glutamyl ligase [Caenibius tardaugens NBRC 16725]
MTARRLTAVGLDQIGDIAAGDDLAAVLLDALAAAGENLQPGDVIALAQKIVSKAEGRAVRLSDVTPSPRALELATVTGKDPRLCELLLGETELVLRQREGLVVVEDTRGMVLANAGIDASNVTADGDSVLLLPEDPDASARALRNALEQRTGVAPAVVIIDSIGRAWRQGTVGTAIGVAGMPALLDLRGKPDMHGRLLETSELGLADEVAAAASLLMGQADERCPAVLLRGLDLAGDGTARDLLRPRDRDMFR